MCTHARICVHEHTYIYIYIHVSTYLSIYLSKAGGRGVEDLGVKGLGFRNLFFWSRGLRVPALCSRAVP